MHHSNNHLMLWFILKIELKILLKKNNPRRDLKYKHFKPVRFIFSLRIEVKVARLTSPASNEQSAVNSAAVRSSCEQQQKRMS